MAQNIPKNNNRPSYLDSIQKLVDGLTKHAPALPQLIVAGTIMTPADAVSRLTSRAATAKAVQTAKSAWQGTVKVDKAATVSNKVFLSALRSTILSAFAGQVDVLADFGLSPRKQAVLTPATRAASALKSKATRAARGTRGKKQKAEIVAPVEITPATATAVKTVPVTESSTPTVVTSPSPSPATATQTPPAPAAHS